MTINITDQSMGKYLCIYVNKFTKFKKNVSYVNNVYKY